jgi:hypothetical protein
MDKRAKKKSLEKGNRRNTTSVSTATSDNAASCCHEIEVSIIKVVVYGRLMLFARFHLEAHRHTLDIDLR